MRPDPTSDDGIRYFDPTMSSGDLFIWDDGVHIVDEVKMVPGEGLRYVLACGQTFTFTVPASNTRKPLEVRLNLPTEPLCKKCLP